MRIQDINELRKQGKKLTREQLSELVYAAVDRFDAARSYKGAMHLAGELKAIAVAASVDDYWREKINLGSSAGEWEIKKAAKS